MWRQGRIAWTFGTSTTNMVYAYVQEHFADPQYGEWFGLLDRRGNRINDAKGLDRKNTYHLCRNAFHAYCLLSSWTGTPLV